MKLAGEKILVTGADGFIGSHLVEELVSRGADVRALVLYNSFGSRGWLDTVPGAVLSKIEVVSGDIRDPYRARVITRDARVVLHLASLIAIPYSFVAPGSYVAANVSGTLHMLQAAVDERVSKFVQVSTSEVYGSAQSVPMTEAHPLSAQSPYAATKIAADQLALSFHRTYQLPVVVARPFNTFGPRQSQRAIIPTIITQAIAGKTITLGSTAPRRDFNFVSNTVDALIAAAESDAAVGDVVHFGSGVEISVGDLAARILALAGRTAELASDARRVRPPDSEVDRLLCDNSKALKLLGWNPAVSLDEGLRRTIEWFKKPENQSRYRPDEYGV